MNQAFSLLWQIAAICIFSNKAIRTSPLFAIGDQANGHKAVENLLIQRCGGHCVINKATPPIHMYEAYATQSRPNTNPLLRPNWPLTTGALQMQTGQACPVAQTRNITSNPQFCHLSHRYFMMTNLFSFSANKYLAFTAGM